MHTLTNRILSIFSSNWPTASSAFLRFLTSIRRYKTHLQLTVKFCISIKLILSDQFLQLLKLGLQARVTAEQVLHVFMHIEPGTCLLNCAFLRISQWDVMFKSWTEMWDRKRDWCETNFLFHRLSMSTATMPLRSEAQFRMIVKPGSQIS